MAALEDGDMVAGEKVMAGEKVIDGEESMAADNAISDDSLEPSDHVYMAGNPKFMSSVWSIVWKDVTIERHTWQLMSVMVVFSLTVVVVFNFALGAATLSPGSRVAREASMGFLWATILLAGTLGLSRSMASELENRSLDAILIAPIDRSAIYLGKVISVLLFTLLVEAILIPVFIVFFNRPFYRPQVLLILFLGTIGYVAAGVLVSSMSSQTRLREVLLPVLLLPLTLPVVLAAATASSAFIQAELPAWNEVQFSVALVVAYDVMMLTAGFLTYHFVVEE
jgi:heme exporter protein B